MTITEFLEARISEDEALANACLTKEALTPYSDARIPPVEPNEWGNLVDNYLGGPMGKHCAQHDPTRVLAECAAKREIIQFRRSIGAATLRGDLGRAGMYAGLCEVLLTLASAHKDHPDFLQEWTIP